MLLFILMLTLDPLMALRMGMVASLAMAGYQDFKTRTVHDLVWLPALAVALVTFIIEDGREILAIQWGVGLLIALLGYGIVSRTANDKMGSADFIAMFVVFLEPDIAVAMLVLVIGSIWGAMVWLLYKRKDPVPVVTFLALAYFVTIGSLLIFLG